MTVRASVLEVRIHRAVIDELHWRQALRVQHRREPLHFGGCGMGAMGVGIAEDEAVHLPRRVIALLPGVVAQRPGFVCAHVGDEFVDCREASIHRFGPHLVARELPDLVF